jgi:type IV pilus assembly protein PilM
MIQLAQSGDEISVVAADRIEIEPETAATDDKLRDFVLSSVKQMLARNNFKGRNVVSCLPSDKLKITSIRLSETESEQINQSLSKEAYQRFGLEASEDSINYIAAGDVQQGDEVKREVILFAADRETIRGHIELLEKAQLKPFSIDTVPCALFRCFSRSFRRQEDKQRTVVFVDVGRCFTTVVFGRGEEITFIKQIPIGGEKFDELISSKLGVDLEEAEILRRKLRKENSGLSTDTQEGELDASTRQVMVDSINTISDELAREISLCFRYYTVTFRGKRVESAFFSGVEAYEKILLNVLKRQLAIDIEIAQPFRGIDVKNIIFNDDRRLLCEWSVAVGLGLKCINQPQDKEASCERN